MSQHGIRLTTRLREWAQGKPAGAVTQLAIAHERNVAAIRSAPMSEAAKVGVIHAEVDKVLQDDMKNSGEIAAQIKCREGCAHCCYLEVGITQGEAEVLISYAKEQGIEIDRARLQAQDEATSRGDFISLEKPLKKCVFLGDDNKCRAYEFRPIACRKYFVITPPELCDTSSPGVEVASFFSLDAEIFQSAAFVASPSGQMAGMILKNLPPETKENS